MTKTFETLGYGNVTLHKCFDPDTSLKGEGFVEVSDENGDVFVTLHGDYDLNELDTESVEYLIDESLSF